SATGALAAASSNISTSPAVQSVDLYMIDTGNITSLGHRRWILSNTLGPVGIGSTNAASCLWVLDGRGHARAEWTAWPPAGVVPWEALHLSRSESVDSTGW